MTTTEPTREEQLIAAIKGGDAAVLKGAGEAVCKLQDRGRTALSLAAALGGMEVVQALLDEGAVDATAVGQAAFHGHVGILAVLLKACGPEALAAPDPLTGLTPLMLAALRGHTPCVAQLLDAAPEAVDGADALGRTPLMLAATGGSVETVKLLAERGAKLDAQSDDGRTALIWAVVAHKVRVVEALALLGANPELRESVPSELVKPGGPDAPKSALDHATQRHGKDPVLGQMAQYLRSWLAAREAGAAAPPMPEAAWLVHAREVAAQEEEGGGQVEEISTGGGGGGGGDDGGIFDDDDAAEPAAAPAAAPAAEAPPPVATEGFSPSATFAGARPGWVFKCGAQGVGYYAEPAAVAEPPEAAAEVEAKEALGLVGAQPLLVEPGQAVAANLDELD